MNSLYLMITQLSALLHPAAAANITQSPPDKILLRSITSLTFLPTGFTTHRRHPQPRPQLKCFGDCSAGTSPLVTCYNRGGTPIKWDCSGLLPTGYHFDKQHVICEGYDQPDDEYILAGSCGLVYSIVSGWPSFETILTWLIVIAILLFGCAIVVFVPSGPSRRCRSYDDSDCHQSSTYVFAMPNFVSSPRLGGGGGGYSTCSGTASTTVI